jgi:hypothetical protein
MSLLIKKLLRQKLNEVTFEDHFYERSEDRLWGKKPEGPASINAAAWEGNSVDVVDLKAYDVQTKTLYLQKHIPITEPVKVILDNINTVEKIDFDTRDGVAIVMWKSMVTHTGKDQNPPGQMLILIIRNNSVQNIQWQPSLTIGSSGVNGIKYIIRYQDLIKYLQTNNTLNITTEDLEKIKQSKSKEPKPEPIEKPTIIVNGSKYSIANDDGDLVNKNNPKKTIKFDELSDELQMQVLDLLK